MTAPEQRCGTCRWFDREDAEAFCTVPLPEWILGVDVSSAVRDYDGAGCDTFSAADPPNDEPLAAHSKSEHKRLTAQGAKVKEPK